jgi:EAL domain-containing protein (putative c-di-GMP-specific phosphodiesterase class I)
VDSREQLAFLREHGCRFGQGFLFSPALPAEGVEAMLRAERRFAVG